MRARLLVAGMLLACSGGALAGNILRRPGATGASTPAAPPDLSAWAPQNAASPLRQALDAIKRAQAAQDAARGSSQIPPGSVPDGLQPGGLAIDPASPWIGAQAPTQSSQDGRTSVTISQDQQRAILGWTSFNVGSATDVHFDQTAGGADASSWVALNRVNDPSAVPSRILGTIRAEGQVYVINRNGVIFGGTSQVNVGTLLVSGLDLAGATIDQRNQRFLNGTLFDLSFAGPGGAVLTEAGARLSAAPLGRVVLLGGGVLNGGSIEAPDGQVLLAAGDTIAFSAPPDLSAIRGLGAPALTGNGVVENQGIISTPRGNITMLAAQTVQSGMLTATTGAQANGSIVIGADGMTTTFGAKSITQVLPDLGGEKVIGSADFRSSRIEVHGDHISVLDGAILYAPSGDVVLSAVMTADPTHSGLDDTRIYLGSGARIDVSGLRDVDVAMEQNNLRAELRANELADDPLLRNAPGLRGRPVWFDGRLGVNGQVVNVSGYYDLIERDVPQLMTAGGNVTLAANEIITRAGSVIDLSGGSLRYLDGYVRSTQLIDRSGQKVRIEDSVPGVAYVGIDGDFVLNHSRWGLVETFASALTRARPRFETGYEQGSSAGTLSLATNDPTWYDAQAPGVRPPYPSGTGAVRILDGDIAASTVVGPKQRELPTGSTDPTRVWREAPAGATLDIIRGGDVTIAAVGTQLPPGFAPGDAVDPGHRYQNLLPARWFDGKTFANVNISSGYDPDETISTTPQLPGTDNRAPGGHLAVGDGVTVNLGDGGSFRFTGKGASIDGTLLAPGGTISLTALQKEGDADPAGIRLGATGVIDVAGRFSNDRRDGSLGPRHALGGGSVALTSTAIDLEPGSLIDVSGGARLDSTGKTLTVGDAGSLKLDVSRDAQPGFPSPDPVLGQLSLRGTLSGYAMGKGGSLTIDTGYEVVIGAGVPAGKEGQGLFTPGFFTRGGFSSYTLVGERSLTVASGTVLAPSVESLVLPDPLPGSALRPCSALCQLESGTRLDDVLARQVLPAAQRAPISLSLSTVPVRPLLADNTVPVSGYTNDLTLQAGASIRMDPGSTVRLSSAHVLDVEGSISTPGGTIALLMANTGLRLGATPSGINLGPQAQLDASGWVKSAPAGDVVHRSIEPGGTIAISSATSLHIDPDAALDVSGTRGVADLAATTGSDRFVSREVDGNAGSISISAGAGVVAGTFRLAPGGPSGLGGSLTITKPGAVFTGPLLVAQHGGNLPDGSPALIVSAAGIDASGADDVTLEVQPASLGDFQNSSAIRFLGNVDLYSRRTLTLRSPILGTQGGAASASLSSAAVSLQGWAAADHKVAGPDDLLGDLTVKADLIDISRTLVLGCVAGPTACGAGGFGTVHLISSGDVRLSDHDAAGDFSDNAGLITSGAVDIHAAQVYVASRLQGAPDLARAADDPGFLLQSDVSISIAGNGRPAPMPLSFGERLTLRAPTISQGGVLRAPAGEIRLEGTGDDGSVTLLAGSLTSTSLEGSLVPFGPLRAGGSFFGYDHAGAAPEKSVSMNAANVTTQKGAVVDVSGGGDLLGFQFIPGNGGSTDILDAPGSFAVVPSLGTTPAPIAGTDALRNSRLKPGDSIWLQGVPGLPDGTYTLLPAHYALLPGGLLVQPQAGTFAGPDATTVRVDGSWLASGYRAPGPPLFGRFIVMPQSVFGQYSELPLYSFDGYASSLAAQAGVPVRTPNDAGAVAFDASQTLILQGSGRFGAGRGGLLGNLDISAPKIAVVGSGSAAPDASYLTLSPEALRDFGAGSVLLGGTRSTSSDPQAPGTVIDVKATDVFVSTGGSSPLTGPEIILAGKSSVTVANGSVIRAEGAASVDPSPLLLAGDGALLRVSTGARVPITHTGATGTAGDLAIGDATIAAPGSLTLDGTKGVVLSPGSAISARQLDLASLRVNLGDAPAGAPGVTLGPDKLNELAGASDLLLRGYDSIHVYGGLALGTRTGADPSLQTLTLDTGLLQGEATAAGSEARMTAGTLTLRNSGGGGQASEGSGTLLLDVDALRLGPGRVQLAGFGALAGSAGSIDAEGTGSLDFSGDISLSTARVSAGSGASYAINAGGALQLTGDPDASTPAASSSLGARLSLTGASIVVDTSIVLPAGQLQASAAAGGLRLGSQASIDVSGQSVAFPDRTLYAPGGAIRLFSAGDLSIDPGASLDVSAPSQGGVAGAIELAAAGQATVLGNLSGAGARGGSFSLDAATLGMAPAGLNATLERGGFDSLRSLRLRQEDIVVGAGERIHAQQIVLQSDTGRVTVSGRLDATGSSGGNIELIGDNGVAVEGTAVLDARASDPVASSGKVEIVATGGRVDVAPGSRIDLSGGREGGGSLIVRAPRTGNDVAVSRLAATIEGAGEVVVQGVRDYQATDVTQQVADGISAQALAWLQASEGQIRTRLGIPGLLVAPGMRIRSASDLTVSADFDLSKMGGVPGYLGLTAAGNIDVKGRLTDGFDGAALLSGRSFSYELASGNDIVLEPSSMIRTGTGSISLDAGRDLKFLAPSNPADAPAVVYTAGRRSANSPAAGPNGEEFPTDGGDVAIRAGRDIVSYFPTQTTSAWLFREGSTGWNGTTSTSTSAQPTRWSVVFANFQQAIGALGGGDVTVSAGRDIHDLQIAIPTTGFLTTLPGAVPSPGDLVVRGGGDLSVVAAGDISGGEFILGRGHGEVRAGGSLLPSVEQVGLRTAPGTGEAGAPRVVGALFGLMDATVEVTALSSATVEAAFDPMRQGQVAEDLATGLGSSFWGYSDRAALSVTALSGPVAYENDPWASVDLTLGRSDGFRVQMSGSGATSLNDAFSRAPPTLRLASLQSSATVEDRFGNISSLVLAPAPRGTLEIFAATDVHLALAAVRLEDVGSAYARGPLDPFTTSGDRIDFGSNLSDAASNFQRGFVPLHAGDPDPARIEALSGSVCAQRSGSCTPDPRPQLTQTQVTTPKPIEVLAGTDVMTGIYAPQNNSPSDFSLLQAGRDLYEPGLLVDGPGAALLQAGRDIVLDQYGSGTLQQKGGFIYSLGNRSDSKGTRINQALPAQGADIYLLAGAANPIDYDGFAAAYLDPANAQHVVRTYLPELTTYLATLGLGPAPDPIAAFRSLPLSQREIFLDRVYFSELKETGIDYNQVGGPRYQSYNRGFKAISLLFPGDPGAGSGGNVLLNAKSLETQSGGDLTILAPYGQVAIGADVLPRGVDPASGGVVTRRGGDLRIMADGNIDLSTSRAFTLQGGDIIMWTTDGSITAGSGSKTSVFQKPLAWNLDNEGVITVDAFGLQTGAGIGVLDALPEGDHRRSRLDLIAPRGEVNAGDAGIRVSGDINIAAQVVLGAENIQVSGAAAGVPKVEAPNIGALTSASAIAQAAAQEGAAPAAQPRSAIADLPSIITVEVVGYEQAEPGTDEQRKKKK